MSKSPRSQSKSNRTSLSKQPPISKPAVSPTAMPSSKNLSSTAPSQTLSTSPPKSMSKFKRVAPESVSTPAPVWMEHLYMAIFTGLCVCLGGGLVQWMGRPLSIDHWIIANFLGLIVGGGASWGLAAYTRWRQPATFVPGPSSNPTTKL